jgi:hypothetical protein
MRGGIQLIRCCFIIGLDASLLPVLPVFLTAVYRHLEHMFSNQTAQLVSCSRIKSIDESMSMRKTYLCYANVSADSDSI